MAIDSAQALKPKILLTGASSQIGVFAIPRLLAAGFEVVAVSRQSQLPWVPVSEHLTWCGLEQALEQHADFQFLLSAGPMALALQVIHQHPGIKRAIIFSSSSVVTKSESEDEAEQQLMQQMLAYESELETLAAQQAIKMTIFRPTLIYGCGLDGNVSRLAGFIERFSFMPVNGKANGMRQPVHADDLAMAAIAALQTEKELPPKLVLTGGSTLSYADMLKAIFKALGKPARIIPLPAWVLIPAVKLLTLIGLNAGVSVAMVKRQTQDLQFDGQQACELLGHVPRPFAPGRKDFKLPG